MVFLWSFFGYCSNQELLWRCNSSPADDKRFSCRLSLFSLHSFYSTLYILKTIHKLNFSLFDCNLNFYLCSSFKNIFLCFIGNGKTVYSKLLRSKIFKHLQTSIPRSIQKKHPHRRSERVQIIIGFYCFSEKFCLLCNFWNGAGHNWSSFLWLSNVFAGHL